MRNSHVWAMVATAAGLVLAASSASAQESGSIRGRVVVEGSLRPLTGAQVSIPGTGRGTLTNASGDFLLANVPVGVHEVQAQMIGYGMVRRSVTVAALLTAEAAFELSLQALALDEVVVTGQAGAARRREVGNAIAQVNLSNTIEPVQSVESLFQGRTAGVRVTFTDATIGSSSAIRLRGTVSATQGNQPLIYVDGVRQPADSYRAGGNTKSANPLTDINPNDIDRVEVIKGAAAATLYGSEAAAGVIQIFTKRGAEGEPRFTYQTDQSAAWVQDWASDQRPKLNMDPWLQTAHGQTHTLSVTGGAPRVRYFVSGSYGSREGVQIDDLEDRYSVRTNLTLNATSSLAFDVSSMFSNTYMETMPAGNNNNSLFFNVYRAPNALGAPGLFPGDDGFKESIDRLRARSVETTNQRSQLGLTANWTPLATLSARATIGYDKMGQDQQTVVPFGFPITPQGQIQTASWFNESTTLDVSASYQFPLFAGMRSTFSAGGQLTQRQAHTLSVTGTGLPGPGQHTVESAAAATVSENASRVNTGGLFVQEMLELNDRLFLTAGVRFDGSSAFGKDFGLEVYPKISASYVISDETFWPERVGTVKLRAAYGFAGRAPGAFDAVRTWEAESFLGQTAFSPDNIGNSELGPERTGEMEIGFDGSFLQDRLTADFTYYKRRTTEALINVGQAPSLGFGGSQAFNRGVLGGSGIELAANVTLMNTSTLSWDLGTTISTTRSEVIDDGGVTNYSLVEGHPIGVQRGSRIVNQDEIADPVYEADAFLGPTEPTRIIGLNTSLRLPRGVTITARGEYVGGHWAREFSSNLMAQRTGLGAMGCDHVYQIIPHDGTYLGPGDDHPNLDRLRAKDRGLCFTRSRADAWNLPRDFAKLREISIQAPLPYQIPGTSSAFITASFQNLFRWVNSEFYSHDPESTGAGDPAGSLTGGSITDHVPAPATATVSVRVAF